MATPTTTPPPVTAAPPLPDLADGINAQQREAFAHIDGAALAMAEGVPGQPNFHG